MRWPEFLGTGVVALAVGFSGGFLFPKDPAAGDEVQRLAGPASGASETAMVPETQLQASREAESEDGPIATRLSPQQIAKRALQWTASIRGEGVYGAGIVVDTHGYVLTNNHVIQGVEKLRVQFSDTEELPAKVVASDKSLDLALVKVDVTRPVAAPAGDFLSAEVGDDVFAMGSPRKMNFTLSRGMVSYIGRRIDGNYYLQSDLATNDGNSGGPIVNDRGEVIAVMTFILRDSQGLAFAVPLAYAYERFADELGDSRIDLGRFERWRKEQDALATASR